jgi:hypothetical protein
MGACRPGVDNQQKGYVMEKLIKALGKILEALLKSKTVLLLLIVVAILSVAILAMTTVPPVIPGGDFFGLGTFASGSSRRLAGLAALVSIILILVRVVVWIIGKVREKYFV